MKKTIFYFAVSLTFCLFFVTTAGNSLASESSFSKSVPDLYPYKRLVQYSFTLRNKTNRLMERAEFWTYAPVKKTSTQHVLHMSASHPYKSELDERGNQILHFTFENLPPYGSKIISIKANMAFAETPNPIPVKNPGQYLQPEEYIEIDAPDIMQFSKTFNGRDVPVKEKRIFQWVAGNLEYSGYIKEARGALYAYEKRKGDCTEYMYLFIALSRANGVPARGIGGYVVRRSTILDPSEYHNWAEFYYNGAWNMADPQKKIFMKNSPYYLAMRIIGPSNSESFERFSVKGDGLDVKMNSKEGINQELRHVNNGSVFYYKKNETLCSSCDSKKSH